MKATHCLHELLLVSKTENMSSKRLKNGFVLVQQNFLFSEAKMAFQIMTLFFTYQDG